MLARRRQELIVAQVRRDGSVRVRDLTTQLGVSDIDGVALTAGTVSLFAFVPVDKVP